MHAPQLHSITLWQTRTSCCITRWNRWFVCQLELGQTSRMSTDVNVVQTSNYDWEPFWDKLTYNPIIRWDSYRQRPTGFDPQTWPVTVCSTPTTNREHTGFISAASWCFLDKSCTRDVQYISVIACIIIIIFLFSSFLFSFSALKIWGRRMQRQSIWNSDGS